MASSSKSQKVRNGKSMRNETKSENLLVAVRVRPESTLERVRMETLRSKKRNAVYLHRKIVKPVDGRMLVFDPSSFDAASRLNMSMTESVSLGVQRGKDMRFVFDKVFDQNATQNEVYEKTTMNLLDNVLDGYNATVFCYGATGSGKTHTMIGNETSGPGILVLTVLELFEKIKECSKEKDCKVTVSYLEVYNEKIRDLLRSNKGEKCPPSLMLLQDSVKGMTVSGLSEHHPQSVDEVLELLRCGNSNRVQAGTAANAVSSRSHAVFQVIIETRDRTANVKTEVQVGKLSLIDLAGSERASQTKNRGIRLTEGGNINKSLLALANCINALGKKNSSKYIPYRDSKLTRLLQDSLGGNCRTVMIANVSPSQLSYEDTYNTLKYANRAKNIKTKLRKNVLSVDTHISKYRKIINSLHSQINELKKDNSALKNQLEKKQYGLKKNILAEQKIELAQIDEMTENLRRLYKKEHAIRQNIVEVEAQYRKLLLQVQKDSNSIRQLEREGFNLDSLRMTSLQKSIAEYEREAETKCVQKLKLEDELKACIKESKRLLDSTPHFLIRRNKQSSRLQSEISLHKKEVETIHLQQLLDHADCNYKRTELLLEDAQNTAHNVSSVLQLMFDEIYRGGLTNKNLELKYRATKQWLMDIINPKSMLSLNLTSDSEAALATVKQSTPSKILKPQSSSVNNNGQNHSIQNLKKELLKKNENSIDDISNATQQLKSRIQQFKAKSSSKLPVQNPKPAPVQNTKPAPVHNTKTAAPVQNIKVAVQKPGSKVSSRKNQLVQSQSTSSVKALRSKLDKYTRSNSALGNSMFKKSDDKRKGPSTKSLQDKFQNLQNFRNITAMKSTKPKSTSESLQARANLRRDSQPHYMSTTQSFQSRLGKRPKTAPSVQVDLLNDSLSSEKSSNKENSVSLYNMDHRIKKLAQKYASG